MQLQDKTILIIGGSSGIGFSVATLAARAGAKLIVTGRDKAKLARATECLRAEGADVSSDALDAAKADDLTDFFRGVGPFDHLVSMAGGFMGGGFLDAPADVIRKAVEEKLFANLAIARLAAPSLTNGGSMVFTAGSGGRPHNASGAIVGNDAIRTLVQGLGVELAPRRCRANAVAPTWTPTPLWRHMSTEQVEATDKHFASLIPLGRTALTEEIASAYIFLMENAFVTGQTIAVDGGLTLVS
ncbi:MAG TPA: SDR family oxidoreductase [Candidatus Sulfotelmatobacter sp.]|jgi:NAD(P)-dependent dehydrogenase (short-subunit alcohol dehydrogenase family)|nr:SDR family oxidoreductase [Candidatus Sulfotelmatobacter sp.]